MPCFARSLVLFFDLRYYKAYRQLRQKAITTPNNLLPKILPITDKNGTAISDGAAGYLACFLGFSILIFHKCNIARILVVQQILHQVCGLLFRHVLRVAVGAFQERRIRMTQQGCCHLFAGAFLQQIGCVEMPQGVQVIIFR